TSPLAPSNDLGSRRMLLQPTTTYGPTVGPAHGLCLRVVFHSTSPSPALRHTRAHSPALSSSSDADAATTRSTTTATGASTCHFSCPCCQTRLGAGRGNWASSGGGANCGSFFFSASYFASSSFQRFSSSP